MKDLISNLIFIILTSIQLIDVIECITKLIEQPVTFQDKFNVSKSIIIFILLLFIYFNM